MSSVSAQGLSSFKITVIFDPSGLHLIILPGENVFVQYTCLFTESNVIAIGVAVETITSKITV